MKAKLLTLACSSLFAMSAFASTTVAIVDLNQAFQQAPQGAAAFNALKQQLSPEVAQLQSQQQTLQTQANAMQANKKLTTAEKATQKAQLMAQQQSLQEKIDAFQKNATQQQQALLTSFGNAVKADVAMISKKEGYDVVLSTQDMIYSSDDVNITKDVVKQLNMDAAAQAASNNTGATNQ